MELRDPKLLQHDNAYVQVRCMKTWFAKVGVEGPDSPDLSPTNTFDMNVIIMLLWLNGKAFLEDQEVTNSMLAPIVLKCYVLHLHMGVMV